MAKKTHGLGRGLDSLFQMSEDEETQVREIDLGELDPNPDQPRKQFDGDALQQLADSIREQGVLQPLLVVSSANGRYRIVAGERRFRAARLAGMATVPCLIKDLDALQQMEVALVENLQREDLNPMETARGIKALMTQCGYTQEKVAQRLGRSRAAVANTLRLLSLPEEVTEMVSSAQISEGHARALAGMKTAEDQVSLARRAVREGLNVRQTEHLAAQAREDAQPRESTAKSGSGSATAARKLPAELEELREKVLRKTGLRCALTGSVNQGRFVLQYSSRQELERFNELLDQLED